MTQEIDLLDALVKLPQIRRVFVTDKSGTPISSSGASLSDNDTNTNELAAMIAFVGASGNVVAEQIDLQGFLNVCFTTQDEKILIRPYNDGFIGVFIDRNADSNLLQTQISGIFQSIIGPENGNTNTQKAKDVVQLSSLGTGKVNAR